MDNLGKIFQKQSMKNKTLYSYRYVDHILICFNGTIRHRKTLQHFLNTLIPNIKCTTVVGSDNAVNFFDLTNGCPMPNFKVRINVVSERNTCVVRGERY